MKIFSDNKRIKYCFIVSGITKDVDSIVSFVGKEFTLLYGGVTISTPQGFWAADGNENKTLYTGKIKQEQGICIEVLITADNEIDITKNAGDILKKAAKLFNTGWEFVHTERYALDESHFKLDT